MPKTIILCAYCGRKSRNVFSFPLLSQACRQFNVTLKLPTSDAFHEPCARKVYAAIIKRPVAAFLQGGIR